VTNETRDHDRKRQIVAAAVTVVTLVVVFAGILPQLGDYSEAWEAVRNIPAEAALLLAVMIIANVAVYPWPYQATMPGLGYGPAFAVSQTSYAISHTVPAGGPLGLAVQYRMLDDYGISATAATAALGINGIWTVLVKVSLPVIALIALIFVGETQVWVVPAAVAGLVVVGLAVGLLVALLHSEGAGRRRISGWLAGVVGWLSGLIGKEPTIDVQAKMSEYRASTRDVLSSRVTSITVTNVVVQVVPFVVFFVALRGIEADVSSKTLLVEAFAAYSVGALGDFIPLTPGGLGTVDALITGLLVAFGTAESNALAATLVWRAGTYLPQIFIGFGTYFSWQRRQRKSGAARRDPTPESSGD
jgi:uncharacterized protein (TIRG00374 family)